jgi:hypothetical protein
MGGEKRVDSGNRADPLGRGERPLPFSALPGCALLSPAPLCRALACLYLGFFPALFLLGAPGGFRLLTLPLLLSLRAVGRFRLRLMERLDLIEALLERFDQALRIGAESFVRQSHGVAPRQRTYRFRQIFRARHRCVADQHRNDSLTHLPRFYSTAYWDLNKRILLSLSKLYAVAANNEVLRRLTLTPAETQLVLYGEELPLQNLLSKMFPWL